MAKKQGKKFKFRKFLFIESFKQIDVRYMIAAFYILGAVILMKLISWAFTSIGMNLLSQMNLAADATASRMLVC